MERHVASHYKVASASEMRQHQSEVLSGWVHATSDALHARPTKDQKPNNESSCTAPKSKKRVTQIRSQLPDGEATTFKRRPPTFVRLLKHLEYFSLSLSAEGFVALEFVRRTPNSRRVVELF